MSYDKKDLLRMYKKMWEIRECDDRLASLKLKDLVMNGFHPYRGEEAVSAGSCDALIEGDYLVSTHRPQGHAIAKGTSMKKVFCELLGRMGGMSNGLGGPMQWVEAEEKFFCGSIVGSGVSYATGFGLALKMKKSKNICLCIFGDGASNTGAFHEGMNLASVWKLPIVFVCENNQYGEAMPVKKFVPVDRISKRAASYGIEGITVDGMDVQEVASAVSVRIEAARSGKGPQFVEALTYRFKGHYMGDPDNYRTKEEIEEWRKRDPIEKARKQLMKEYGLSEKEMKEIEDEITKRCDEEKEWALRQPKPTLEYAVSNVMIPINGKGA